MPLQWFKDALSLKVEESFLPLSLFVSPCDKSTNQKTRNNHMKKCGKVNID
jgi:hypothetical protein